MEEIKTIGYLFTLIPIGVLLKIFIDNWKATDLEKIMMSNLERFQIGITKHLLIGAIYGTPFYVYVISLEVPKEIEGFRLIIFIAIIIVLCVVYFLIEKLLYFVLGKFSFKFDYYILDEKNEPYFRVIKSSGKNHLLVESNGIEAFIENPKSKRYKKIRRENDKLRKFYQSRKIYFIPFSLLVISVGLFIGFLNTTLWLQFIFYLLFVILLVLFIVLLIIFRFGRKNGQRLQ